jgi:hypothetical protein
VFFPSSCTFHRFGGVLKEVFISFKERWEENIQISFNKLQIPLLVQAVHAWEELQK